MCTVYFLFELSADREQNQVLKHAEILRRHLPTVCHLQGMCDVTLQNGGGGVRVHRIIQDTHLQSQHKSMHLTDLLNRILTFKSSGSVFS